jgi:hypothetical protein
MAHQYNTDFMRYADCTSRLAAQTVIGLLQGWFAFGSVLDVGCAKGTWLSAWSDAGTHDIRGIDGDYVDRDSLVIPAERFSPKDLASCIDFSRRFDIVQSLEVAEHIQASAADTFVGNLVRHASGLILFSAAPPGQGGEFHVNEQPYEYWQNKFAAYGYVACDCLRPRLAGNQQVSFWYRYNMFLYVRQDLLPTLHEEVRASAISSGHPIRDISPRWFKLRKAIVRHLPSNTREWLARTKARWFSHSKASTNQ